jgi:hypothetical protein
MKYYKVLPEYIDLWTNEALDELVVDSAEIERLSREWGKPIEELMEQVEETEDAPDYYFDAAVQLMDDELREQIHADLAPCTNAEFLREYERRHLEKYGEEFEFC